MSDRIAVMQEGRIYQIGDPVTVYRHPTSSFVADFVGTTNLFRCTVECSAANGPVLVTDAGTRFAAAKVAGVAVDAPCQVSVRPEFVRIGDAPPPELHFAARVVKITFVGNVIDVSCALENGEIVSAEIAGNKKDLLRVGESVTIGWDFADMGVFPAE